MVGGLRVFTMVTPKNNFFDVHWCLSSNKWQVVHLNINKH
jgi:hypothetical protein